MISFYLDTLDGIAIERCPCCGKPLPNALTNAQRQARFRQSPKYIRQSISQRYGIPLNQIDDGLVEAIRMTKVVNHTIKEMK